MTQEKRKTIFKNEYLQTALMIVLIVVIVLGFWYGSQYALNTNSPFLAVASGSMCVTHGPINCDGWSHPFDLTLHVGDLIIIQGVKPEGIYTAPVNRSGRSGDIIVFQDPIYGLIVHRAIGKIVATNGTIVAFITKGDANSGPGPGGPSENGTIPVSYVVGKVVMRIPWIGHLALLMRNSTGLYLVVALIIVLVAIEFILPESRGKKKVDEEDKSTLEPDLPEKHEGEASKTLCLEVIDDIRSAT